MKKASIGFLFRLFPLTTMLESLCFLNSKSNFRDDYHTIKYDDNDNYKNRIYSCLEKLDNDLIVLFCHEDMFLYNKPNFTTLNEYINLIKENFPSRFKHTLYNYYESFTDIIDYETNYTDKYGYIFEFLLYKIYLINLIYPIFHYFFSDSILFCLLFAETTNENKKIKYSFDIDAINNYHTSFFPFYNIVKYNSILFDKFFKN